MLRFDRLRTCIIFICAALLLSASACGAAASPARTAAPGEAYAAPAMKTAGYDAAAAETTGDVGVDFSGLADGYIAVSARSDRVLKFQILLGDGKYSYDLPSDGTPFVYPLNMGDGDYTFRVMQNVGDDRYTVLWSQTRAIALASEFEPFLRPSCMVPYDAGSDCVAKARELAADCADDVGVVSAVYEYLVDNISYDDEKAKTAQSSYLPDPDATLSCGTGICFDYAALAAAMLRSEGIPCRLVTGYLEPDGVYHAWNEIYIQGQGWITVRIEAPGAAWKRVDITLAASGVPASRTDNDSLYTTRYVY